MKPLSKDQIKHCVKVLRELLQERNIDLKQGHALEIFSKVFGFSDWNTAAALLKDGSISNSEVTDPVAVTTSELPLTTKFSTVGEAIDFFSRYSRETKLVVNDYTWVKQSSHSTLVGTVTSACSLTFDQEIQRESELILELNTENESSDVRIGGSQSASQTFDQTKAGRLQRQIKTLFMKNSFWNPQRLSRRGF